MATYLDPNAPKKPTQTLNAGGASSPFPQPPGMPNPVGASAPAPPPGPGMPNPVGASSPFPPPTGGMPNPLGVSADASGLTANTTLFGGGVGMPAPPPGPGMPNPVGAGSPFPPPTGGMPNPLGVSADATGLTANTTLFGGGAGAPAPPAGPGMPNPLGAGAPAPPLGPGMPNPVGTSAPAPPPGPGMPNPVGTSAPGPVVQDPVRPPNNLPPGATYMAGHDPSDPNALVVMPNGQILPQSHPLFRQAMGGGGATPGAPGGPASPAAPGQPVSQRDVLSGTATPGANTQGQPTTVAGAFQQALINRLVPQDISSSNPAIKGSIEANRNAETRGLSRTQELLAERAAASGQSGAQESLLSRAAGDAAGRQGAFEGNALYNLHQQQAADLRDAMALGGDLLSDQQRQELQRYGIDLDATLRREGLDVQRTLGGSELDIRRQLGLGQLDLSRRGLDQNESQFSRSLGAQLGTEQARLNQQALLSLLAGL